VPWLAAFTLMEDVWSLDLTGKWPTKARASANINSGPRPRCRRWSSTIYDSYPRLMGLYYASSKNGNEPAVAYDVAFGAAAVEVVGHVPAQLGDRAVSVLGDLRNCRR
jgi:hypothetical protein